MVDKPTMSFQQTSGFEKELEQRRESKSEENEIEREKAKKERKREIRRSQFKKIAEKRTIDIVDKIRILGNTANRSMYEYKEEEVEKIFKYIRKSLDLQKEKFTFSKKSKNNFKL